MFYSDIHKNDIANGIGCRVSLFVSGCRNHCPGCFQPQTWAFDYGDEFTKDTMNEIISALSKPWIRGLSILGGDPLEPENAVKVKEICENIRALLPDKDIWLYTGYKYEDIMQQYPWLEENVDVIVDGRFEQDKKVLGEFRGSSNQRIADVKKTLSAGKIVYWKPYSV